MDIDLFFNDPLYEKFLLLEIDSYCNVITEYCSIELIKLGLSNNYEMFLIWESKQGNYKNVKYLLENKKINIQSGNNEALINACGNGHFDIVKILVEYGADVNREWR
jgi:ankyrin repeat protein